MNNPEYVQLHKENFDVVMELLGETNIRCKFCGDKVTKDNFGMIAKDIYSCNNLMCQIEAVTEFETVKR